MRCDEQISESGIDAALRAIGPQLDAQPSTGAIERARAAVRLALNEAWLAALPQPAPADLGIVRERIHGELATLAAERRRRIGSAFAAAACLALCFGLIRWSGTRATVVAEADAPEMIDAFVRAGRDVRNEGSMTWSIEAELDFIEKGLGDLENDPLDDLRQELIKRLKRQERKAGTL